MPHASTKNLTWILAASILTASIASAQAPPAVFQSQGIKATFTSISLLENKIVLQFSVQNTRQSSVYLAIISGLGGSSGTLMATNGSAYEMELEHISGMS